MKTEDENRRSDAEVQFELKYCERCGGLWLRPMGGGQIYCRACWGEMKKLPTVITYSEEGERMARGPQWYEDSAEDESYEEDEGLDLDAAGGTA
jgi:Zn-finger nucleic acid-binding protein